MKTLLRRLKNGCRQHAALLRTLATLGVILGIRVAAVHAGTDTTFDDLNVMMSDWSKGSLGKALALIALLLGIGMAAAR